MAMDTGVIDAGTNPDWFSQFHGGVTGNKGYGQIMGSSQPYEGSGSILPGGDLSTAPFHQAQGGTHGDPAGFQAAWFASGGKTTADLKAFVAAHPEFGATITGSKGSKLTFPGGQAFQAVRSAGLGGGIGPAWDDISGGGDAKPGAPSNAPYNFATDDPSYQWRLAQGLEGVQKSAAANGTLLTGGTLKDLVNYGQGAASQEYGAAFGRKQNLAQLGLNAAGLAANTGSAYGANSANLTTAQGNANAQNSLYQGGQNANTIGSLFNAGINIYGKYAGSRGSGNSAGYPPNDTNGWG